MPLETVRLKRVFGVVQTSQNRRPITLFGFESASRKEYSVAAPGKPRIESGMTITAYLTEANNWETLIGWRDHETGEIVCQPEGEPIFLCAWSMSGLCMTGRGVLCGSIILSVIAIFFGAVFGWGVRSFCRVRRARQELEASASPVEHQNRKEADRAIRSSQ